MTVVYLAVAAAVSSVVGSVTGIGGGILLLVSLSYLVSASAIVPIHATVQSVSCFSRVLAFKRHIRWDITVKFYLGMVPCTVLAALLAKYILSISPSILLIMIGTYVLFVALKGKKSQKEHISRSNNIIFVGALCGLLGIFVGSTGPILSSWLLDRGILKEGHVATKSAMQLLAHTMKIVVFVWFLGFALVEFVPVLILMCTIAVVCTFIGKGILSHLDDRIFSMSIRVLLVIVSLNILINEIPKVLA